MEVCEQDAHEEGHFKEKNGHINGTTTDSEGDAFRWKWLIWKCKFKSVC